MSLERMLRRLIREEHYLLDTHENSELGISVGFVGNSSMRPGIVWNRTNDIGCIISGEVFLGLADLNGSGPRSQSAAAASELISLYRELGLQALERLNGWFVGLILDRRNREVILFNDRYGRNRLYIAEHGGQVFFSTEAKSLLAALPECRKFDGRGLGEWFLCGCTLQNRTIFKGISVLPPGSAWVSSPRHALKKQSYFDPKAWELQSTLSSEEYYQRIKDAFPRILKSYTNGHQPVAMSLTGGLDGRMIMAWSDRATGDLPCYTFNGPIRDCADVRIARKVAKACGQSHRTIQVGNEFFTEFPRLAQESVDISDGTMDVTGAAELYVNRIAREIAPVRLTGNYGSEILRQYVAFRPGLPVAELCAPEMFEYFQAAAETYTSELRGNRLSFIAFKQVPWHHFARFSIERSQLTVRSPFLDNGLVALAFRAPSELAANAAFSLRLIADGNPVLGRIPTDRGVTYPGNKIVNRMHRSVQEFLAKSEYAYDYGMPNWLARVDNCFGALHLERLFLGRQKFCHFRTWYRHELSRWVKEILLSDRILARSYLRGRRVQAMVNDHLNGRANYTQEITKMLTLELIQRSLLENCQ